MKNSLNEMDPVELHADLGRGFIDNEAYYKFGQRQGRDGPPIKFQAKNISASSKDAPHKLTYTYPTKRDGSRGASAERVQELLKRPPWAVGAEGP